MDQNLKIPNHLLKHLGALFFSIAKADRSLAFDEYVKFSELLDKNWKHITDIKIDVIKKQFNNLQKQEVSAKDSYNQFIRYYKKHPEEFSGELKMLILKTFDGIAYAYSKFNKAELYYLTKLRLEFERA